jgi:thiol-disulfide isomerase/thioredoxin
MEKEEKFLFKYNHSSVHNRINTGTIMRLSLITIATCLLASEIPFYTHNINYAGQGENENADNKVIVEVTLILEGNTIPGKPKVVSAENTFDALHEKTSRIPLDLKKIAENTWACHAEEGHKYVIGWIAKKGWFEKRSRMFGYCSEPFTAKEGLTVEFSPGMPATFEYDLRNPPKGVVAAPAEVLLLREIVKNDERTFLSWMGGQQEIKRPGILIISGLAGGTYKISARVSDTERRHLNSRTPVLYADREVIIKPGLANRFDPNYPGIDSTIEEGDVTIRGTLYGPNKKPLANKTVHVIPLTRHGFDLSLYYPSSTTDSNGRFEFVGIRPNRLVYVSSENSSINLGKLSLVENASVSVDIVLGLKKLPVAVGKPLEEIFIDWKGGNTDKLSDLRGKTVALDVWATWCAPCIKALPELNSLAAEYSDKSNFAFVALSIDDDQAVWKKMVNESNWNALRHGRLDVKKNAFVFNRPIPYSIIIDKDGIVRAEGNGLNIRLELDKLTKTSDQSGTEAHKHSTEN